MSVKGQEIDTELTHVAEQKIDQPTGVHPYGSHIVTGRTCNIFYSLVYLISAPWSWIIRLGRPGLPLAQAGPRTPGRWQLAWVACVLRPLSMEDTFDSRRISLLPCRSNGTHSTVSQRLLCRLRLA